MLYLRLNVTEKLPQSRPNAITETEDLETLIMLYCIYSVKQQRIIAMPEATTSQEMTQLNARIPRNLKSKGDAVIVQSGLTVSQAIRRLYELAAASENEPNKFREILYPRKQAESAQARRMQAFHRGANLYAKACLGLELTPRLNLDGSQTDDEELRFEEALDRYGDVSWK